MKLKALVLVAASAYISTTLLGCGGGGGSGSSAVSNPLSGVFVDSPVAGIHYRTETLSGTTGPNGEFQYRPGETVTFSIGDVDLPSAKATSFVTPLTLVGTTDINNTAVVNIARLLQTLDSDSSSSTITISDQANTAATGMSVDFSSPTFDTDVGTLVTNGGGSTTLVDATTAVTNMQSNLTTAQLMSGTRWILEYDDGLRADGTTDMHCEEVSTMQTITVGSDGSWHVSGVDTMNGPFTIDFATSQVTIDEASHTATLMDADGQGKTIMVYDPATNKINSQWQKMYNGQWLANYETWTYIVPSVATMMAGTWDDVQLDDGLRADGTTDDHASEVNAPLTITVNPDGSWNFQGTDASGAFSLTFPAAAVTIDESTYSVTLMDADGLGRTILTFDTNANVIRGQWQKYYNGNWLANYETWTDSYQNTCPVP